MDFGGGGDFGGGDAGHFGGGHGIFDFGHNGHGGGHGGSTDYAWLWGGGYVDTGSSHSYTGTSRQAKGSRVNPPLLLSAAGGVIVGAISNNGNTTFALSLLTGAVIPYVAMHKPNLTEVAISAGTSLVAGVITQVGKQKWADKAAAEKAAPVVSAVRG